MTYQPKKKRVDTEDDEVLRPITKRKRRDPPQEAVAMLEQLDQDAVKLDQAIQQMSPLDTPVKAVNQGEQEEEDVEHLRICPFHMEIINPFKNNVGVELYACGRDPCLVCFTAENKESYLKGLYRKVNKDLYTKYSYLACDCGFLPGLRQSKTGNNPDRMYLACREHKCKYFRWADQPIADPADVMTCPCHLEKMEERTAKSGWQYLRCPAWRCLLFCDKTKGEKYMSAVRKNIHPDICDRWTNISCLCGEVPIIKQSGSSKNPDRLYLACGDKRCEFFRWTDLPVDKENFKDPLAVQDWLSDIPPPDLGESNNGKEIRPPIYGEGLAQAEERLKQTYMGRKPVVERLAREEIIEVDPPVYTHGDPVYPELVTDYVPLHKDVKERGKLGLF